MCRFRRDTGRLTTEETEDSARPQSAILNADLTAKFRRGRRGELPAARGKWECQGRTVRAWVATAITTPAVAECLLHGSVRDPAISLRTGDLGRATPTNLHHAPGKPYKWVTFFGQKSRLHAHWTH